MVKIVLPVMKHVNHALMDPKIVANLVTTEHFYMKVNALNHVLMVIFLKIWSANNVILHVICVMDHGIMIASLVDKIQSNF